MRDITDLYEILALPTNRGPNIQIPSRILYPVRPTILTRESSMRHATKRWEIANLRKSKLISLKKASNLEQRLDLQRPQRFNKADDLLLDVYSLGDSIKDIDFAYIEQTFRGKTTEELYLGVTDESGHVHLYSGPAVEVAREEIKKYALKLELDNSA